MFFEQGVGGVIELAPGYLPAVYKSVRKAGGLCIADEVQCGFARTGSHFWGFEAHGVTPDIVTLAKVKNTANLFILKIKLQHSLSYLYILQITGHWEWNSPWCSSDNTRNRTGLISQ